MGPVLQYSRIRYYKANVITLGWVGKEKTVWWNRLECSETDLKYSVLN